MTEFIFFSKKLSYNSVVYMELFYIYGFSFYSYFILMKGCRYLLLSKFLFSFLSLNKLYWIHFFLSNCFLFDSQLRLYTQGRKLKYLSYFNFKHSRILLRLPVRGQRTQTNAKTCKIK